MVINRWAKICEKGHTRYITENRSELSDDQYCDRCGSKLYETCPSCDAPIRVIGKQSKENGFRWEYRNHCYNCGNAYPWRPSRLTRAVDSFIAANPNPGPSPSGRLLTENMRETLEGTKYGHEVISHIRDGDDCYRNNLWQPALGSYIHAFEWGAITYLESEADLDIIEKERDGVYYNFAKNKRNLLDELQQHVEIDQKTISSIESMNRAERRWMAHHKSGTTLPDEVDAVRARLGEFLKTLFQ